ncbi:hypothetical protein S7335_538 [Synechococcus sp. PCC 7335]|uniref:hypothetical protein n=1 Tax=Synechococcus sp. (strain ATCC 29403 / PCC 7335) TaxID=91464 RepID=UPI00017EBCB0|nr:hypothetical protein [Synechococcus sp. PCC 7335]EDX83289.1 hypothetical protein S7335_469 [Synechococcus sp. PCC 7335]EDX83358.1 hypothetical protein S7335_538 [Synechococcus sp. PCC 7335]
MAHSCARSFIPLIEDAAKTIERGTPIHLKGVPQAQLRRHIRTVIGILQAKFGQDVTITQDRQPAAACPFCLLENTIDG